MTVYQGQGQVQHANGQLPDGQPDALRADIEQARTELGETLQALAARADVRSRARSSAMHAAERARAWWLTPVPWAVVSAGLAAAALVVLARRTGR